MGKTERISERMNDEDMTKAGMRSGPFEVVINTSVGGFLARYSRAGLCGLEFPSAANGKGPAELTADAPQEVRRWHAATVEALNEALEGRAPRHLPPLDLSAGTDFQRQVWQTLREIVLGETWSYAEVAKAIGKPKAVRAVGGACGANPIPV